MKDWEILIRLTRILMELVPQLEVEEALNLAFVILEEVLKVDHYGH